MSRTKPAPLPVATLFNDPLYADLPCAARGMVISLCEHFWRTEGRPRPKDDDQLFALARAHRPTWRHHRENILTVFDRWAPSAATYFERRRCGLETLRIVGQAQGGRRRLSAGEKTHTPPEPRSEPRLRDPVGQTQPAPERARIWTD